ncbi:MAG: hypothetical protein C4557_07795 [Anaerolineaceae bacterium]|nr:MAG: hypothetical protein C4557_07795 [Anaerolineaceae bacterium]
MTRYFSTSRPIWAYLYQVTTAVLPQNPIVWQVFALFWRWLDAVVLWAIFIRLFPNRRSFAFAASLFFLLYPGFNQQWVSYLYAHFFIVLFFLLFSWYAMLRRWTMPALILSALNLLMLEYFFLLELARPIIIWISLRDDPAETREKIKRVLKVWTPYLVVFLLAIGYRAFVFSHPGFGYSLADELRKAPLETTGQLIQTIVSSLWQTAFAAWALMFKFPSLGADGPRTTMLYGFVAAAAGALTMFGLWKQAQGQERGGREISWALLLGVVLMLLGGPPFWLTNVPISLGFPANRATLSFMLGVSLFFAGALEYLPARIRYAVLVIVAALASGRQFLWANEFRRDWASQKNMFWQMTWRAPGLEKKTIVLVNEHLLYYADNSLGAALNWIYAPENHTDDIDYVLFYPTNRRNLSLEPNVPFEYDFIAGSFKGNTSQVLVFHYSPPKCLRLLDPEIDSINRLIPDETLLRDAASLSSTAPILSEQTSRMPDVYGPEPSHGWCYYFEKADLARQNGNWDEVVRLGETAFALDDHPNDPVERFVFIEGYAHVGGWKKAVELSVESYKVSKNYVGPLLCKLWDRIERETKNTSERESALLQEAENFECKP